MRRIFVIFNYRPHRWLVAEGLKPREPSEEDGDEVQLDERRTERSARMLARRRAREETQEPGRADATAPRNVRVSDEL